MIVDAVVWCWTKDGMRRVSEAIGTRYIEVAEAERLLEEAHRRGYTNGSAQTRVEQNLEAQWSTDMGR